MNLTDIDRRLLNLLQDGFPLCRSPYAELGRRAGLTEAEALSRVAALRRAGFIRRIGGVLDSRRLGMSGTLVAMKVPPERVEEVAAIINASPRVTHNYLREHEYNMWFTLSADSPGELADSLAEIRRATGIDELLDLPATKVFKINVKMEM